MPTELEAPPAAPAAQPTPAPTPAPAAPEPKAVDPFSTVKFEAPKPDPKGQKPTDKKEGAPAAPEGDKKLAIKKDQPAILQERVTQQNAKIATQESELKTLRSQVEEMKTRGGGDTAALTAEIDRLKSENQRLGGELGAKDYTKSQDYISKYDKPFNEAAEDAKNIVESLTVLDADGNERAANWKQDFASIYSLPRAAARLRAKEMFGEDAASVMNQYDNLHRLDKVRQGAVGEWQKGATEREQAQRSQQLQVQQKTSKAFETITSNLRESDPMFQEKPDDAEHGALWKQSQQIVDDAYFNRGKKSVQELVLLDAAIRLRAINEPILRSKVAKLQAELDDYKARIEGKEASRSGGTRKITEAPAGTGGDKDWQADLRDSMRGAA